MQWEEECNGESGDSLRQPAEKKNSRATSSAAIDKKTLETALEIQKKISAYISHMTVCPRRI